MRTRSLTSTTAREQQADKPVWRKVFDALEGRAAPPIEKGVRSDLSDDALAVVFRTRRGAQRSIEQRTVGDDDVSAALANAGMSPSRSRSPAPSCAPSIPPRHGPTPER